MSDTAPKRRWFHYGEPWGLFAKTNPKATLVSVAWHGIAWAMIGVTIYAAFIYWREWSTEWWLVKSAFFALFFGSIGGLMEWQVDDSDDGSLPPPAPHS